MITSSLFKATLPASTLLTTTSSAPITITPSPLSLTPRAEPPVRPSQDPFYTPPIGFETTSPGTILRHRPPPAPLAAFGTIPLNIAAAYQLLYRTTSAIGNPEATVITVIVPHNANTSRLVSYQDFEDAVYGDCATSYSIQEAVGSNTTLSQLDFLVEGGMLYNGWIVAMPDYEGPESVAFSGIPSGYATLDGIRAVLASQGITGIAAAEDVEVQMWGYSGGSIATEYAAELQPSYAPELKIIGAVVGGAITNLTSSVLTINNGYWAGFSVVGILGLAKSYSKFATFIDTEVLPATASTFYSPNTECASSVISKFQYQDIGTYLKDGIAAIAYPEVQTVIAAGGQMGVHGVPKIPMYFYKSIGDDVSPVADNDKLVKQYCSMGIESLVYTRNSVGNHLSQALLGGGGAVGYLSDRFNGVAKQVGCKTIEVAIARPDFSSFAGYAAETSALFAELFSMSL